jgi:hypothetical protein
MAVPAADKHQRAHDAAVKDLTGLAEGPVKAMVEANPDQRAGTSGCQSGWFKVGGVFCARLLHQDVFSVQSGSFGNHRQDIMGSGNEDDVNVRARHDVTPVLSNFGAVFVRECGCAIPIDVTANSDRGVR